MRRRRENNRIGRRRRRENKKIVEKGIKEQKIEEGNVV